MFFFGKKKKAKKEAEEKAAAEKLAAERAAAEKKAVEQRAAAEKAAAEKRAAEEKAAAEKRAAEERAAAEQATAREEAERRSAAAKKAAATRAANKAEADRIEAERLAAEQAEAERIAALKGFVMIKPSKDGRYVYVLYAGNKQVIAKSAQTYASVANCRSAVESVAKIAAAVPVEDQTLVNMQPEKYPKFELYMDKGDKYRFRLCASNGQNLLTCTQGYTQKVNCKNGIQSVIVNCAARVEISTDTDD